MPIITKVQHFAKSAENFALNLIQIKLICKKERESAAKMIKGVNKQIIEINSTNSAFFDKAVLYIKPSMRDFSSKALAKEAQHYISKITDTQAKRKQSAKALLIAFAAGCGFGVAYAFCINFLF